MTTSVVRTRRKVDDVGRDLDYITSVLTDLLQQTVQLRVIIRAVKKAGIVDKNHMRFDGVIHDRLEFSANGSVSPGARCDTSTVVTI